MAKISSKKVVAFNVPQTAHEIVRVQLDKVPYFYDQLHQHPEIQIMLVEAGEGTLVAGDYVGRFAKGDVFIIGGGQPHVFRCDPSYYDGKLEARSTSLYFNERYFGKELWEAHDLGAVRELAESSSRGLQLVGEPVSQVSQQIHEIAQLEGLARVIAFFQLLQLFSVKKKCLRTLSLQPGKLEETEEDRMNKILSFTFQQSHRRIYLEEVAQLAHLSVEAFCRYFKLHTRKTYVNFLHEVRISQACQLLIRTDLSVDQIGYRSGFANISNFNRVFKRITGRTPLMFRRQLWVSA